MSSPWDRSSTKSPSATITVDTTITCSVPTNYNDTIPMKGVPTTNRSQHPTMNPYKCTIMSPYWATPIQTDDHTQIYHPSGPNLQNPRKDSYLPGSVNPQYTTKSSTIKASSIPYKTSQLLRRLRLLKHHTQPARFKAMHYQTNEHHTTVGTPSYHEGQTNATKANQHTNTFNPTNPLTAADIETITKVFPSTKPFNVSYPSTS